VVVDHEDGPQSGLLEPPGDGARAGGVVRHETDERRAAEADERGHASDLEQTGLAENRCGLEHL
jgi:hypothetical protein